MKFTSAAIFVLAAFFASDLAAQSGPNRPEAKPLTLDSKTTAVLVLDLSARCQDAKQVCSKLMKPVGDFLEKARGAGVPVIFTVSQAARGGSLGEVATPLRRAPGETVLYPDGFDKFTGGELQGQLQNKGIKTLVITGSSSNAAVLYTATTATRAHRYTVVIPMDGINASSRYEEEYSIHQFTVLPSGAAKLFQFTRLSLITFR